VATQKENQIELNLEDAQPTEIDVPAEETSNEVEVVGNDEFKQAESATQKRIDKLTKKMRVAEREREEALRYAQHVKSENDQYKTRLSSLDVNYVKEYGSRVDTEITNAEESLKSALDLGNNEAAVKAQKKLSDLAIESIRLKPNNRGLIDNLNKIMFNNLNLKQLLLNLTQKQKIGRKKINGLGMMKQ